ncbi:MULTISPECIES: hypothetical protein [unclassified Pseudoxanthomonas]|uniref:hypothetical protein n=1 Tax=unclassified Pseudoxanthomonas TaxID=2645906 RepID=UPI00307EF679
MLSWLVRQDLLCDFAFRLGEWLSTTDQPEHEHDIDGHLDDIYASQDTIDIGGREIDVEKLADHLCQLHGALLSTDGEGELLEPLWIAESLSSWSATEQARLTTETGEFFSSNWKFDRSMRADVNPMLALVAHVREPQLCPDWLTYAQLLIALDDSIVGTTSIDVVARRLSQHGIAITAPLLTSILRNDYRYLLVHSETGLCACKSVDVFVAWPLATALFEPSEYLKSTGLGFDGRAYWDTSYRTNFTPLKAFFDFHQRDIDWTRFDTLEVCLKLAQAHVNSAGFTQGIPSAVHKFIINWILTNQRVWRIQDSDRTLGHTFSFDPEDVSPGRLMVYGSSTAGRIGSGALVVREMVSRDRQLPGLIHSSRVLTPFEDIVVDTDTPEVESLLLSQAGFKAWGIAHIDDLAEQLLRKRGHASLPYTLKLARLACTKALPATLLQVGRGLLLAQHFDQVVEIGDVSDKRRKQIVDHLLAYGVSRRQIPEQLSGRVTIALLG